MTKAYIQTIALMAISIWPGLASAEKPRHHALVSPATAKKIALANRAATRQPRSDGFVNAVQIYPYSEGMIYQLLTAPGRITDILLQPGETLGTVASGDTARWIIGDTASGLGPDKRTHILVKPFATGLATNLVIATDRRSYHLALRSDAGAAMAAVSWNYPQDELLALKHSEEAAAAIAPIATGLSIDQLHFNYAISGDDPSWRPIRAFDDGRQTFIEFPASLAAGQAPPLFLIGLKGEVELVNYRLRGHFYVVDRLFDRAQLRLGTDRQSIVQILRVADGLHAKRQRRAS